MVEVAENQKDILIPLFQGLQDSLILSCIQNYFGTAWVDDCSRPASGRIMVGEYCFLAGEPSDEFLYCGEDSLLASGTVIIPDTSRWYTAIERVYGSRCQKKQRYGIKKEGDIFDRKQLRKYAASLREGYALREIDRGIYERLMSEEWSQDLCKQFRHWEHFQEKGMGIVVCQGNKVAAGASSFTSYREGIEVVIATKEAYRRQGLALACGSALILKALEQDLYPHWDAANMASVGVATKLGYHYDKPYEVYAVR